ncbi:MAG TPA: HAMP domain-containing sensor histidine kinase, partial [bacterium]|nr:HAMP domain-containing sensor histidine kinase [bacterium]
MKKLFGKFQRLSAKPTGGETSTGLGLSIVKQIIEMHEGQVWAESESGKGSTFVVELPRFTS